MSIILPYKQKTLGKINNMIKLKFTFDNSYIDLNKDLKDCFNSTCLKFGMDLDKFRFLFISRILPNLKMILMYNFKFLNLTAKSEVKKCHLNCSLCKYHLNYTFIRNYEFLLPVYNYDNCCATDCVYIIKCMSCNVYYVGQTKNLRRRMHNHKSMIVNYSKFSDVNDKNSADGFNVAIHFNNNDHIIERDFRFIVFRSNILDKKHRLNVECDLINIFLKNKLIIVNEYLPNNDFTRFFCFTKS